MGKFALWGLFLPPERFRMDQFGLQELLFSPKTPRNGSVWVSGPLSPQEHSEMGKFGLQGLYFIFYPQNTQKWANSAFRASFSPRERSEMGQFRS